MMAMIAPFGLQGRAHRGLVGIRPARYDRAAPSTAAAKRRTGRDKEFASRGRRTAPGKLFGSNGCSHCGRDEAATSLGFNTIKAAWDARPCRKDMVSEDS